MYKSLFDDGFFYENELSEVSPYTIATMTAHDDETLQDDIFESAKKSMEPSRIQAIDEERRAIENETDTVEMVRFLRKQLYIANKRLLAKRVLEREEDFIPIIISKLRTSRNDAFIENVFIVFVFAKNNYSSMLMEKLQDIRYPYAAAMMCVIIGLRGDESAIPWMFDKYYEMLRRYPEEDFSEGPLLALNELYRRFYDPEWTGVSY